MSRVTILLGKGGTGRTTVARALGLAQAGHHDATAVLHADPTTELPEGHVANLSMRALDPYQIIEDALAKLLPFGPLTRSLARHPAYESFLEIAPGIKEAAILNFVYGFLGRRDEEVILDGPATGHGLHFLEAPSKLESILAGKLAARMRKIDQTLRDPERTRVVLVALPEELPAVEVVGLRDLLAEEGFPVVGLVVNRMPPPVPFQTGPPPKDLPPPGHGRSSWAIEPEDALSLMAAQRREAERWLEELEALELPTRIVPSLPGRPELAREVATFLDGFPPEGSP